MPFSEMFSHRSHPGSRSRAHNVVSTLLQVGLVLNNAQIANINKMRSTLRDLERWEALYRHRPKHKIKDGPKAWYVVGNVVVLCRPYNEQSERYIIRSVPTNKISPQRDIDIA